MAENLEAGDGDENTILQLIDRYATSAIFPRVLAVEESRVARLPCEGQAAFMTYAFRSDPVWGASLLEERLGAHNNCSATVLSEVASRHMTPEIEHLAIAYFGDSDPQVAAGAAATLGRYGSAEAEQALWDRLEEWHAGVGGQGEPTS